MRLGRLQNRIKVTYNIQMKPYMKENYMLIFDQKKKHGSISMSETANVTIGRWNLKLLKQVKLYRPSHLFIATPTYCWKAKTRYENKSNSFLLYCNLQGTGATER